MRFGWGELHHINRNADASIFSKTTLTIISVLAGVDSQVEVPACFQSFYQDAPIAFGSQRHWLAFLILMKLIQAL